MNLLQMVKGGVFVKQREEDEDAVAAMERVDLAANADSRHSNFLPPQTPLLLCYSIHLIRQQKIE